MNSSKKFTVTMMLGIAIAMLASLPGSAATPVWNTGYATWNLAGNWTPSGVPAIADTASINNGGCPYIDISAAVCATLRLGYSAGNTGWLVITNGGGLVVTTGLSIGGSGNGVVTQYAGSAVTGTNIALGASASGKGTYNMQGGTLVVNGATPCMQIGGTGTGVFQHVAGNVTVNNNVALGFNAGGNGSYQMTGGGLYVTNGGTPLLVLGWSAGSAGSFIQSGGAVTAGTVRCGQNGNGTWTQTGGSITAGTFTVGYSGPAKGLYTMTNAIATISSFQIGSASSVSGVVTQYAGSVVTVTNLSLGGTNATYDMSGGSITANAGGIAIFDLNASNALFRQSGGDIAFHTTTSGGFLLEGGVMAQYLISGGTLNLGNAYMNISHTAGRSGTFAQTGGVVTASAINIQYNGVYNYYRGTLNVNKNSTGISIGKNSGSAAVNIGIADPSVTNAIAETGSGAGVAMTVRSVSNAVATLQGNGIVGLTGSLTQNGRVIADGYGYNQTLDLSTFSSIIHGIPNTAAYGSTANGWFAQNQGRLLLPPVTVTNGTHTYCWGDASGAASIDLVNSVQLAFTGISAAPGPFSMALLATNRTDMAPLPAVWKQAIGLWTFTPAFTFTSLAATFRYDAVAAGSNEGALQLYQQVAGSWTKASAIVLDTVNKKITASLNAGATAFAIAVPSPNPPGTLIMLK